MNKHRLWVYYDTKASDGVRFSMFFFIICLPMSILIAVNPLIGMLYGLLMVGWRSLGK